MKNGPEGPLSDLCSKAYPRSARAGSSALEEPSSVLLEVSLDGDEVVVLLLFMSLDDDDGAALELLSTVDEVLDEGVDESVPLMVPEVLLLVPSFVGRAEVEGELLVVGATYGLDAALGELLLGTESLVVCAMVTPAALTMAMTAAMLKVLDTSFIFGTPLPETKVPVLKTGQRSFQTRGFHGRNPCRTILT